MRVQEGGLRSMDEEMTWEELVYQSNLYYEQEHEEELRKEYEEELRKKEELKEEEGV